MGTFTYSQEENTGSYQLGDPVPDEVKRARQSRIMEYSGKYQPRTTKNSLAVN